MRKTREKIPCASPVLAGGWGTFYNPMVHISSRYHLGSLLLLPSPSPNPSIRAPCFKGTVSQEKRFVYLLCKPLMFGFYNFMQCPRFAYKFSKNRRLGPARGSYSRQKTPHRTTLSKNYPPNTSP